MKNHVWNVNGSNRCMFCGVNDLDDDIYGPYDCTPREPLVWISETGSASDQSNPAPARESQAPLR